LTPEFTTSEDLAQPCRSGLLAANKRNGMTRLLGVLRKDWVNCPTVARVPGFY